MNGRLKMFLGLLVGAAVCWMLLAWRNAAGQRLLFYAEGHEKLSDYWMPRMCLEQGYRPAKYADWDLEVKEVERRGDLSGRCTRERVQDGEGASRPDGEISECGWYRTRQGQRVFITSRPEKVYPAFALLPLKVFPKTWGGAYCWTILAGLVFLASLVLCACHCEEDSPSWWPLFLAGSMPFLFNLERGNPIWLSAAAIGVFLAWWDSNSPSRRRWAAICLGVAAVMKIAPAVLGVLYLARLWACVRENESAGRCPQCREIAIDIAWAAGTAVVFFFGSWIFVPEKFAALPLMIQNATNHADTVRWKADFGLVAISRAIRIFLKFGGGGIGMGMMLVSSLSQLVGVAVLLRGAWKRDYLLIVGGLLLAAGNMYYYGALYLLPVFVLQRPQEWLRLALWFVVLCPLQLVLAGHSSNVILCNFALYALIGLQLMDWPLPARKRT